MGGPNPETNPAARPAFEALRDELRAVVSAHAAQGRTQGVPFAVIQSTALGALLGELALTIAAAPARCHRGQVKVIADQLARLVAMVATGMAAEFPGEDA